MKREANKIAKQIIDCFKRGNKCLVFGNGGSLQDAGHFSAEFNGIGPVIALNDPAKITSIGNDYGFENIFSRQVFDLSRNGDLIIGISSSGKSTLLKPNPFNFPNQSFGFETIICASVL